MQTITEILQHLEQARANEQLRKAKAAQHETTMARIATLRECEQVHLMAREAR